jgi:hypothetical protein
MSLFYVAFVGEVTPLLIDADDACQARKIARDVADSAELARVVPIPTGIFCAELFAEDEDGNEVAVDPLDHVVDYLDALDAIDVDPAPPLALVPPRCGSEADVDDELVTCTLHRDHAGTEHEGLTSAGELATW